MSKKLPALTSKDVLRVLQRVGFVITTGSHYILKHPTKVLRVTLPWHNRDLKRGTLGSIIDQAGFSVDEFVGLL